MARGEPEPKPLERLQRGAPEGVRVDASGEIEAVVGVGVAAAPIRDAVEGSQGVGQRALQQLSMELQSDIAVGDQVGGEGSLDEEGLGGGLQTLEADGWLELAR